MEYTFAAKISKEIGISLEQVAREEWEMLVLKELFDSPFGNNLVFRGGTALRLCHGSPRFSDDLDFSELKNIPTRQFTEIIRAIPLKYPPLTIIDLHSKFFTHLAEFKIQEAWLPRTFRLKIEVRKKAQEKNFELRLITSPVTPVQALGNAATLEQIYNEKLIALKERKAPRDLFDLWFIGQKLKIDVNTKQYPFDRKKLKQELCKYLPFKYRKIVEIL